MHLAWLSFQGNHFKAFPHFCISFSWICTAKAVLKVADDIKACHAVVSLFG